MRGVIKDGIFLSRKIIQGKYLYCKKCEKPLYETKEPGFFAQCLDCGKSVYLSDCITDGLECQVFIARNDPAAKDGVSYLVDNNTNERVLFNNEEHAKQFLKDNGIAETDLNNFGYIDSAMQIFLEGGNVIENRNEGNESQGI